jgi:hypothetical protein
MLVLLDAVMMLVLLRLFAQVAGSTAHCVRPRVQVAMVSSLLFLYYSATNCYGDLLDVQWRFVCSM